MTCRLKNLCQLLRMRPRKRRREGRRRYVPPHDQKDQDMKDEEVTFESLPEKPSETMEADFSPADDEEMAPGPLPDLHPSPVDKDISLGGKT